MTITDLCTAWSSSTKITEKLKYVLVHNLGVDDEVEPLGDLTPIDAEWYGLNNYLLYTINPCWSANLRAEWLRDDDGMRVAGPGNIPGVRAWHGAGYAGNFYEVTLGLNWRPTGNWLIRPEVRFDWYDGLDSFLAAPAHPAMPPCRLATATATTRPPSRWTRF